MFTYAYRCTQLDGKYCEENIIKGKKKKPNHFAPGRLFFEALCLKKVEMHTVFPDVTQLSTFAYKK